MKGRVRNWKFGTFYDGAEDEYPRISKVTAYTKSYSESWPGCKVLAFRSNEVYRQALKRALAARLRMERERYHKNAARESEGK